MPRMVAEAPTYVPVAGLQRGLGIDAEDGFGAGGGTAWRIGGFNGASASMPRMGLTRKVS